MSYGKRDGYGELPPLQESPQQRPRGCNPIFLILICVGVFIMFNSMRPQPNDSPGENEWNETVQETPRRTIGNQPSDIKRSSGDWDMEELDAVESKQPNNTTSPAQNKKTVKGDWSIEEAGAKNSSGESNTNAKTNNPTKKPQSKKTKKGDWEIEEVGGG